MDTIELISSIITAVIVILAVAIALLIQFEIIELPDWWLDILDQLDKIKEKQKMLDPSGMLWDDPKIIEDTKSDEEKEILKLYKGMTPSMQKAIKDIMITTQIKEDKKDE